MDNNDVALYIRRKEMLIEMLQHLGCYDEYIRNYAEFHLIDKEQVLDNVMHCYQANKKHNPFFHIFCCEFSSGMVSFLWSGTPEGNGYWSDIWEKLKDMAYLEHIDVMERACLLMKRHGLWKKILLKIGLWKNTNARCDEMKVLTALARIAASRNISPYMLDVAIQLILVEARMESYSYIFKRYRNIILPI